MEIYHSYKKIKFRLSGIYDRLTYRGYICNLSTYEDPIEKNMCWFDDTRFDSRRSIIAEYWVDMINFEIEFPSEKYEFPSRLKIVLCDENYSNNLSLEISVVDRVEDDLFVYNFDNELFLALHFVENILMEVLSDDTMENIISTLRKGLEEVEEIENHPKTTRIANDHMTLRKLRKSN